MKPSPERNDFAIRKIATDDEIPFRFVEKIISKFEVKDCGKRSALLCKRFLNFVKLATFPGFFQKMM